MENVGQDDQSMEEELKGRPSEYDHWMWVSIPMNYMQRQYWNVIRIL